MEKAHKTHKGNDIGNIVIIASILSAVLVIENARYLIYIFAILIVAMIYVLVLSIKKPRLTWRAFSSPAFLWILLFTIEMFVYGYFGEYKSAYSLKFHILNVVWLVILLIVLYNTTTTIIDLIAKASSIVIVVMSLFILCTGSFSLVGLLTETEVERVGFTAVGNENTTAISYVFMLIPIVYKILIDKKKCYIPFALIDIIFMLLTGSKKGIISLILIIFITTLATYTKRSKLIKNILKATVLMGILLGLCYFIPSLQKLIWSRLVSMVETVTNFDITNQSSTGLRLNFIVTAFMKAWDKPILGHGWASFAPLYGYSTLYKADLYTHNNYAEVLFSFGMLGMILYYWFPVRMILKTRKNKVIRYNVFCWLYIAVILFIDFGTVSCYSSILGFLGFIIVSLTLQETRKEGNVKKFHK